MGLNKKNDIKAHTLFIRQKKALSKNREIFILGQSSIAYLGPIVLSILS